eukprot:IDg18424t1
MDKLLSHLPFVAVYIDDIVVFSASLEEHVAHVLDVVAILNHWLVPIRIDKSRFGCATSSFAWLLGTDACDSGLGVWLTQERDTPHRTAIRASHRSPGSSLLVTVKSPSRMLLDWFDYLSGFSFTITHVSGKSNVLADALSRQFDSSTLSAMSIQAFVRDK